MLAEVEKAFDDVASCVVFDVLADRPATNAAAALKVSLLVGWFRNDRDDPAGAQVLPDRAGRICLIAAYPIRAGASSPLTGSTDAEVVHQNREHWRVTGLARADQHHQRHSSPVDEVMYFRAQPAPGPADSVVSGFVPEILVTRQDPLCQKVCDGSGSLRADGRGLPWAGGIAAGHSKARSLGPRRITLPVSRAGVAEGIVYAPRCVGR